MPFFRRKTEKKEKPFASPHKANDGGGSVGANKTPGSSPPSSIRSDTSPGLPNGVLGEQDPAPYGWGERPKSLLLQAQRSQEVDGPPAGYFTLKPQTPVFTSSRLSKTICEVLHDKDALPYFIQFMNSRGAEHIIKFWLDAESFQASSWTRIRSQSLHAARKSSEEDKELSRTPSSRGSPTNPCSPSSTDAVDARLVSADNSGQQSVASSRNVDSGHASKVDTGEGASDCGNLRQLQACGSSTCAGNTNGTCVAASGYVDSVHSSSNNSSNNSPSKDCSASSSGVPPSNPAVVPSSDVQGESSTSPTTQARFSPPDMSLEEKLKKSIERDAVNIYSKYISLDATSPIGISEDLRNEAISKICREDGQVDPQCFVSCQSFVVDVMDREYFSGFLQSDFHCKHQIDILTGSQVQLADVLYNESAMFYFMEFMEQEGAIDLLQCWLAIDNFQQQLAGSHGQYNTSEAQNDAMVIYEKYFSLQATCPLGFNDKVRFEVECNICRENGPLPDCFATPKREVLRTIEKGYFPQFLKNDLYYKYLSELINTIQTAHEVPQMRRKRAGSDASSEHSAGSQSTGSENVGISVKNTLLAAMDTSGKNIKKALNKIDDDMRIDSNLLNPDALWMRPQAGKMSLGRVNAVGQFISELDPEPEQEKKKITIAAAPFFKKKKDKEKMQEEMALQIAQMIISDVANATQVDGDEELADDTSS